jgi:hypothetical protein
VDEGDAGTDAGLDRQPVMGDSVDGDRACVGCGHAAEDLHQRRLAGAVFADEADNLARPDLQRKPVQRDHAGIGFAHALETEERGNRGCADGCVGIVHHA